MREQFNTETHARLRSVLALGYALMIVYASLSPFTGWGELGVSFGDVLRAPFRLTYTPFDAALNLLSYIPLGLLVGLALRNRLEWWMSVLAGIFLCTLLSISMEYLQMFLPTRVSANVDILTNSLGGGLGVILAVSMSGGTRLFSRLVHWRSHVFHHGIEVDFGLALLALWMFGQTNPSLPMLGNVFISEVMRQPFSIVPEDHFDGWEAGVVVLNLLMLGVLLLTLLRMPRRVITALLAVLSIVATAKFLTAALLLKSWALLLWINSEAVLGVLVGMGLLFWILRWSHNAIVGLGMVVALGYFYMVNFLFDSNSPEVAKVIYHWHYRHLLTYNGLAHTIALIFPLLLLIHLWRVRKQSFL